MGLSGDPITSAMALPLEIRFTELVIRPYPGRSASDYPASARRRSNASLFAASDVQEVADALVVRRIARNIPLRSDCHRRRPMMDSSVFAQGGSIRATREAESNDNGSPSNRT